MENFIYARSFRDLLVYKQAFVVILLCTKNCSGYSRGGDLGRRRSTNARLVITDY
jgi:hypothetical protein